MYGYKFQQNEGQIEVNITTSVHILAPDNFTVEA